LLSYKSLISQQKIPIYEANIYNYSSSVPTFIYIKSTEDQKVFTADIDNFWTAYDSIQTTKDSLKQIDFIQKLYIDKGTKGLKTFMAVRNYTATLWVQLIRLYPKFWNSIRPNTLTAKSYAPEIEKSINKFKELYPGLKEAKCISLLAGSGQVVPP
jgi:hypothetical protein